MPKITYAFLSLLLFFGMFLMNRLRGLCFGQSYSFSICIFQRSRWYWNESNHLLSFLASVRVVLVCASTHRLAGGRNGVWMLYDTFCAGWYVVIMLRGLLWLPPSRVRICLYFSRHILCGILRSPQCCHVYLFGSVGTEPPLWLRILINPKTPYGGEKFENHSTRIIFPMVWSSEGTPDHSRRSIQMMTLLFTVIIYRDKKKIKNGTRTPDHSLK